MPIADVCSISGVLGSNNQLNFVSFIILSILLHNHIKKSLSDRDLKFKIFTGLILCNLILLGLNIYISYLKICTTNRMYLMIIRNINFAITPSIAYFWMLYTITEVEKIRKLSMKHYLLSIPFFIHVLFGPINYFTGYSFWLDEFNFYNRGDYFIYFSIASYFYLFYATIIVIKNKNNILKDEFIPMLSFGFPSLVGTLLQVFHYGLNTMWTATAISILVAFINVQDNSIRKDYLTGLLNRRTLDFKLSELDEVKKERVIGGVMIDIDDFKIINDTYGHLYGDEALQHVSSILIKSFRKTDYIFRYAGDEFMVILELQHEDELKLVTARLNKNLELFNEHSNLPFEIKLSVGSDILKLNKDSDVKSFISEIDSKMYEDKLERKKKKKEQKLRTQTI